jgi:polyisoprenoid-binding protein YceI
MSANPASKLACGTLLALLLLPCPDELRAEQYRVNPGDSDLRVLVFRSGMLATLAHNHVISSSALAGTVVAGDTAPESAFDLHLPVASLLVDEPEIRAEEGQAFSAAVSEKDIAGTRRNMMGKKMLQAGQFDDIRVTSRSISGEFPNVVIEAGITIRGERHVVELPAMVERYDDRIVVTGRTDMTHSDLGLTPFTAAFGTLRVGERMTFKYRIVAVRSDQAAALRAITRIQTSPVPIEKRVIARKAGSYSTWAQAASVHFPLLRTMLFRALTEQRNETMFRSCHMSVVSVSPG